jgi:serine/threonine-protein kinase
MPLTPGTRLGSYEIISLIGAGGMGEVYRAKDTNLDRDVAIKVLPASFALDGDRVARFTREAKTLASLNQPHIAAIYGLEKPADITALVMELVEGEDLAQRIARGAVPLDEALPIAWQIADALEAAHEQGIVHRDLKPANIKIRPDGMVKVLDFGLAKVLDPAGASGIEAANSPTLTGRATQMGMILGTAAYMAPEQARGKPVDRRADIWAFGVVLYEVLSGRRAFEGDDVSITIANVLKDDLRWEALPNDLPPSLHRLLRRCLEKDPRKRLRDIGEARLILEDPAALEPPLASSSPPAGPSRSWWRRATPIAAAAAAASIVTGAAMWLTRPAAPGRAITRFTIPWGEGQERTLTARTGLAISPDGTRLAYIANRPSAIYVREMGDVEARPRMRLGSGLASSLVFSPDGRSMAYVDNGDRAIKRIDVTGGAAVTVCSNLEAPPLGLTWSGETLVFATLPQGSTAGSIMGVAASGGQPERIIQLEPGEIVARPQVLDDGRLLFAVEQASVASADVPLAARIVVQRPGEKARTTIVESGSDPRYLSSGHLIYASGGVIYARTWDPSRLVVGGAVPMVEGVLRGSGSGSALVWYAVSDSGTLINLPGPVDPGTTNVTIALFDRAGKAEPLGVAEGPYREPRMSPDGRHIAFGYSDARDTSVWVYDLAAGGAARRLTFGGHDRFPIWSSDSQRVIFQSDSEGDIALFWQRADGVGAAERLTRPAKDVAHVPQSASPDGKLLLVDQTKDAGQPATVLGVLTDGRTSLEVFAFMDKSLTPFGGVVSALPTGAVFSPDGRWVAYSTRDAGQEGGRTLVQPFPATGAKFQISPNTEDAHHPVWSSDGKELFYTPGGGSRLIGVTVTASQGFAFAPAPPVVRPFTNRSGAGERPFDAARDGKRFLGLLPASAGSGAPPRPEIRVVLNWFDELKARAPVK